MNVRAFNRSRSMQYAGLRKMIAGLREIASGEVVQDALARFEKYVNGRIKGELRRHVDTGLALNTARTELSSTKLVITLQRYRRYIKWSWRKGTPRGVLMQGQKIFAKAMADAVKGAG
ncbi:MAG: hypothetical protein IT372_42540 [Polyangiaceae bacterium]|nr:hypothetical protein [Polyangiaceae bacterium]